MKTRLLGNLAPGNGYNLFKLWFVISLVLQVTVALLPIIYKEEFNGPATLLWYFSLTLGVIASIVTKGNLQIPIAYGIGVYGILFCFITQFFDLSGTGILIFLLSWSMSISVGYGREYYPLKAFFGFMSFVQITFSFSLIFESQLSFPFWAQLSTVLVGTFIIATNIFLWSKESKMQSTHYSERRKSYEDIAFLSQRISLMLMKENPLNKALKEIALDVKDSLQLNNTKIFLFQEESLLDLEHNLIPYEQKNSVLKACIEKQSPILIHQKSISSYESIEPQCDCVSEIAIPIFANSELLGVIWAGHKEKGFFKKRQTQALQVIASFCGIKIAQEFSAESIRAYEKSQAEIERIKELDQMKTNFITNVSHDLKTPLSLIKAPAQQLLKEAKDDKTKTLSNYILKNTDHLSTIVNQLLQLHQIERGEHQMTETKLFSPSLFEKIMETYPKGKIETEIDTFSFDSDAFYLSQICHNLISNAIKYTTKENAVIQFTVQKHQNHFTITVEDQGIGIESDQLENIFNRFYKIDPNNQSGTGIGLSLVKEYVNKLNGEIDVKSKFGKGSIFTVILPLKEYPTEASPNEIVTHESNKPILLIIEDHPDLNLFLKDHFEPNYEVYSAFNGKEALEKLDHLMPDLILTDLMMPEMDGKTFIEKVRENEFWSPIPIIVLSAKNELLEKVDLYQLGIDNYLLKPFEVEELEAVVNATFKQRKMLRENLRYQIQRPNFIASHEENEVQSEQQETIDFIQHIKNYILENLDQPHLSSQLLSKELNIGRNKLQQEMKLKTGLTPVEFIRSIRLMEAKNKLTNAKNKSISEIAYEVGFNNLSYFTRSFKQEFGVLPSEIAS